jgi:hypothetical protein
MEVVFIMAIICGIVWMFISWFDAENWVHPILATVVTLLVGVGLYFYFQLPIQTVQEYTIATDLLPIRDDGDMSNPRDAHRQVIFSRPTTVVISKKKRWGSVDSYTLYEVKGE